MRTNRRDMLMGAAALGAMAMQPERLFAAGAAPALKSMTGDVTPISRGEYLARIDKARELMGQHGIGALLIEPGASLVYFTGIEWWRSERLTAAVLPRDGDIAIVTPHFEEPSVRESLKVPADMRVWHEDQDPLADRRRHPARSKSHRARGHRRNRALFRRGRIAPRAAERCDREWRAGRARLPHGEVRRRTRADAEGVRHHHRRLSSHRAAHRSAA